ncbi:MAG: DUF3307 domain-containing protein [Candidatus Eisenbacteria bacterium]|nr:DUF3307 domain-containing protein [Candidatus Eisenbacteria bacterium]
MPVPSQVIDTPPELFLVCLLTGHIFADFLVQTPRIAQTKGESVSRLLLHGLLTWITHTLFVLPFWSRSVMIAVLLIALVHTLLDGIKGRLQGGRSGSLAVFFLDQGFHLAVLLAAWAFLVRLQPWNSALLALEPSWMAPAGNWMLIATGLVFNGKGATAIVRLVLERFPEVVPRDGAGYNMGRTIGVLERILIFILVLLNQWGALGLVLAAKSIARFKELNVQHFADYYLIGTLTSLLVAIVTGVLVKAALAF